MLKAEPYPKVKTPVMAFAVQVKPVSGTGLKEPVLQLRMAVANVAGVYQPVGIEIYVNPRSEKLKA